MTQRYTQNTSQIKIRDEDGKYQPVCSFINHREWSRNAIWKLINMKKNSLYGANIIKKMLKDGLISRKSSILCTIQIQIFNITVKVAFTCIFFLSD